MCLYAAVLMLLGLMSLILVATQRLISKICIPNKVAYSMLPCHKISEVTTKTTLAYELHYAKPQTFEDNMVRPQQRLLASVSTSSNSTGHCASKVSWSYKITKSVGL